ncbi:hypothetical protein VN97_g3390 [Penicillium thymicola]|uniref:Uncharacterized protein n=1 Tax=Penicillium thymicola TaxID=293382 RepID=A0AAI9TMD3_PENTH|nr:hypothetical protein VN97_g3390 [Penicillium thymicola]
MSQQVTTSFQLHSNNSTYSSHNYHNTYHLQPWVTRTIMPYVAGILLNGKRPGPSSSEMSPISSKKPGFLSAAQPRMKTKLHRWSWALRKA